MHLVSQQTLGVQQALCAFGSCNWKVIVYFARLSTQNLLTMLPGYNWVWPVSVTEVFFLLCTSVRSFFPYLILLQVLLLYLYNLALHYLPCTFIDSVRATPKSSVSIICAN